jgi:hypothetical protein
MAAAPITKRDFALDARRRGLRIYPMCPNSDEPAFPEADCFATRDEGQTKEWWKEDPDRNIGIATDNLLVLRVKTAAGATALGDLLRSRQETAKTARIILDCPGREQENCVLYSVPKGVNVQARSNVAPGVDVLGFDDVIVGPGSTLNGTRCVFVGEHPAAPAPRWLMDMCVPLPESKSTNVVALRKTVAVAPVAVTKTKEEWALEAALYIPVFPICPYVDPGADATPEQLEAAAKAAKTPLVKNWQNLATQDPRQIREWFRQWPNANIGGSTDNLIVVDVDKRHGGEETFAALDDLEGFPETATTNTQGGGRHLFYVGPDGKPLKGGNNKLGKGIDIKARGGYVLLPGSTIEGRVYTRANESPIAFAPPWIIDQLKAPRVKTDAAGKRLVEEDDTAVQLATDWMLKHAPTAYDGEIDDTTFKVSARLYDFGCSQATVFELVSEWDETHCFPQNNPDRLPVVVESAGRNRENAIGSKHPLAPGFEAIEIDESKAPDVGIPRSKPADGMATMLSPFDSEELEDRPWVIPGFACRTVVTMLAGPGGVAKSTYYLMLAVALASGRSDICGFAIPTRERVWVWNQEDDVKEMRRRIVAIMKAYNVSWADMTDTDGTLMIYMDSGVDKPLMLAQRTDGQSIVPGKQVADVIASIKANRISVMTLDPLVEFHEASENDNVQMRAVLGQVRRIAVEANCAALLSTHTRKPPGASSDGFAGEMDAARGASSQLGVVRIAATIFGMSPKDEKAYRLPPGTTRRDFVRIDIAKNNLAPVLPEPMWFTRESVKINGRPDGESVGVLRPVTLDKRAPTSTIHLPTILAEIIATKLSREKHFKVSEVLASATPAQQAMFGDKKNRARLITDSFEGSDVSPTDSGYLTKTSAQGKPMTLQLGRSSSLPQQPKTGGRGLENGEDTEA